MQCSPAAPSRRALSLAKQHVPTPRHTPHSAPFQFRPPASTCRRRSPAARYCLRLAIAATASACLRRPRPAGTASCCALASASACRRLRLLLLQPPAAATAAACCYSRLLLQPPAAAAVAYPTVPSSLRLMSSFTSAANSSGSSLNTCVRAWCVGEERVLGWGGGL